MASLPNPKTVTYEEWLRMPEVQDATEEVVNGEIRIIPPPKWKHAAIVRRIRLNQCGQDHAMQRDLPMCRHRIQNGLPPQLVAERQLVAFAHKQPGFNARVETLLGLRCDLLE